MSTELCLAALHNVRSVLLACMSSHFFQVIPWQSKKCHNEPYLTALSQMRQKLF
jgi:hypothetical protein